MQLAQHENTIRETHDPLGQVGDSKLGQSNLQEARWQLNACFLVRIVTPHIAQLTMSAFHLLLGWIVQSFVSLIANMIANASL